MYIRCKYVHTYVYVCIPPHTFAAVSVFERKKKKRNIEKNILKKKQKKIGLFWST